MSLRKLPAPAAFQRPQSFNWDAPADALSRWADAAFAAEADDPNSITIMDVIGEDMWTGEGVTENRIAAALRKIGPRDVTVKINSPGGDLFAGMAIYNLLREHPARVTVKVLGIAASAASLIAMAGDEVLMGTGSVLMVHNAWGAVIGNRHDFEEAATVFATFDKSMAAIYAGRTGLDEAAVLAMLDGPHRASDGTYMTAAEAVEKGFADRVVDGDDDDEDYKAARAALPADVLAKRRIEAALAKTGVPRKQRAALINEVRGARDAAPIAEREAGDNAALEAALASLRAVITAENGV
jgi:ATP-dependent Clp protease protease subunit